VKVISPSSFSFSFSTVNETTHLLFSSKNQVKMPDSYNVKSSGTNSQVGLYTHFIWFTTNTNPGQPLLLSGLWFQLLQLKLLPLLQHVSSEPENEVHMWLILFRDGSYYYSNPNGSTYHNNGQGGSTYTAPSGNSYSSGSKK
jgi:hypothetical protein